MELYFKAQSTLPNIYWIGYTRGAQPPNGLPQWAGIDGTVVSQYPNNTDDYAHWHWNHFST